ncbi:MAG: gliding motility-associated C-terminal domain-containing protein [Saprospiraceae bacterium]|nr:gliding motility-associated C-terminal domain-containing protein [Saprospiraceae bacterium]
MPGGCTSSFTKNIEISNQPVAEKLIDGAPCSVQTGNGDTFINLFTLLKPGFTSGGTWAQISPASPQLTIPVTGVVDFTGQTVSSTFLFRYTVSALSPCLNANADVMVTVKDCNCPDTEIDCSNCDLCNDNGVLDLTTTIVNPANFSAGIWTITGPVGVNVPLVNGTILDATGLLAGPYIVQHTLVPTPPGNCIKFDTINLTISDKGTALIKPDTLLCNGSLGTATFDLDNLRIQANSGSWVDDDGNNLTNTKIDLTGLAEGTVLSYTFVVSNSPPCQDSRYPVTISITGNCNCEQISLGAIPSLCTNLGTFDLKTVSSNPKPGTWKSANPALIINNGVINLTSVPAGPYQITYELDNPEPNCPKSKAVTINVFNPKSAGTARGAQFCVGEPGASLDLRDYLEGESGGGKWTFVTGGPAGFTTNGDQATFDRAGRPAGTYVFRYAFTTQSPCPDDEEEITIKINPLPVADAGTDKNTDCSVQTAVLGTDNTSDGVNLVYEWKLSGTVVASTKKHTVNKGGDYTLTVKDTVTNCSASDIVKVIQADDLPVFDIKIDTIACFGQTATITLSNILGGKSPYQISFDGGKTYGTALVAANLKSGTYKVQVKDANGCVNDQLPAITIIEPPLFTVNLVDDFLLNVNEDSLLTIKGQYNEATAKSVIWKANGVEVTSAKNKSELLAKPEEDTEYTVTVINASGCIATDAVRITLKRVKPECVPNIFTPDNEGENNFFSINCSEVAKVTKYSIYDRWGNLLFTGKDLLPSQPQTFWDGKFKGKDVVPGVYVYYLEMLFKDGSTEKDPEM